MVLVEVLKWIAVVVVRAVMLGGFLLMTLKDRKNDPGVGI